MESQLTILSESLDRKLEVLQKIQEYNKRQEEVFSAEKVDIRQFDAAVEEKQHLIDEVVRLDDGFEILYEKLAKELFLSRPYLSRRFKEETGESLTDFILKEKTEEAKRLLRYSGKSLTAIGNYLGFSSQSHFARVFKKYAKV